MPPARHPVVDAANTVTGHDTRRSRGLDAVSARSAEVGARWATRGLPSWSSVASRRSGAGDRAAVAEPRSLSCAVGLRRRRRHCHWRRARRRAGRKQTGDATIEPARNLEGNARPPSCGRRTVTGTPSSSCSDRRRAAVAQAGHVRSRSARSPAHRADAAAGGSLTGRPRRQARATPATAGRAPRRLSGIRKTQQASRG
jgi:hypothetical protein